MSPFSRRALNHYRYKSSKLSTFRSVTRVERINRTGEDRRGGKKVKVSDNQKRDSKKTDVGEKLFFTYLAEYFKKMLSINFAYKEQFESQKKEEKKIKGKMLRKSENSRGKSSLRTTSEAAQKKSPLRSRSFSLLFLSLFNFQLLKLLL